MLFYSVGWVVQCARKPSLDPQVRQGIEAQQRSPLHAYHSQLRRVNYNCYFFEPITVAELDKVCVCVCVRRGQRRGGQGWGQEGGGK